MLLLILILAVHDGDTLMVNLPCNVPQVCNKMPIRINGIDTPELLDPRPEIRAIAQKARARTIELTSSSTTMHIVGRDK
jgi:endonuclease YncB( thermonuclease family)